MDRNGKKAKAAPDEASLHAERSDMKTSRRDEPGRAPEGAAGGKGKAGEPGAPAGGSRKGGRR